MGKEGRLPVGPEAVMRGLDSPERENHPQGFRRRSVASVDQPGLETGNTVCINDASNSLVTNSPQVTTFSIASAREGGPGFGSVWSPGNPRLLSFRAPLAFNTSLPRSPWSSSGRARAQRVTQVWGGQAREDVHTTCSHSFSHNSAT